MWNLLWLAIKAGNPGSWIALGCGALALLSVTFTAGVLTSTHSCGAGAASVAAKATIAQKKHDQQQHKDAVAVSNKVETGDQKHDQKVRTIVNTIHVTDPAACDLPQDQLDLVNKAGHYSGD